MAVADQRMPGMSDVELLEATRELYPDAKRDVASAHSTSAKRSRARFGIRPFA